jgi:putative acetyltransferase
MTKTPVTLRACRPGDLPALMRLFRETVHTVNRRDYTAEQVEAWAPARTDLGRWRQKFSAEEVVVAERDGQRVGFCSWTPDGYLDFLYVHQAHPRQGVASALYAEAERALRAKGLERIHTQVSLTAQPFFMCQGFKVVRHQTVRVRGVDLPNIAMEKLFA